MSFLGWFTSGFVCGCFAAGYGCLHAVHTLPTAAFRHPWQLGGMFSLAVSVITLACMNEWFPEGRERFGRQLSVCSLAGVGFFCPFLVWEVLSWFL